MCKSSKLRKTGIAQTDQRKGLCKTEVGSISLDPHDCRGGVRHGFGLEWEEETDCAFAEQIVYFLVVLLFHICYLLDPWPWPEGSYKLGSVCPSVLLGIGSLVFSESKHGVRGPFGVVPDRAGILKKKIYFCPQNGSIIGFFEFIGKFSLFRKFYINCCILAQILYLGKI